MQHKEKPVFIQKNFRKICDRVLLKIKPCEEHLAKDQEFIRDIMKRLDAGTPEDVSIELAGSVAKGTNLAGDTDFDVFMLFPSSYSREELVVQGLERAKKVLSGYEWELAYAEHPYLRVKTPRGRVDIVPSYKIRDIGEKGTSVDRSQLHTRYIQNRLNLPLKDDVRLLKRFMKGIGAYGAELKTMGFSGYLCELLIVNYGSFRAVLEAASGWRKPFIDPEKHYSGSESGAVFDSPLVVIDPVDRTRNVAAVVSPTNFSRFVYASRSFLASPSVRYFFPRKKLFSLRQIAFAMKRRGSFFTAVEFKAPRVVPDVLWPQMRKALHSISSRLERAGFRPVGGDCWSDERTVCVILFELEHDAIPGARFIHGPEVWFAQDLEKFKAKHRSALAGPFIQEYEAVCIEKRTHTCVEQILLEVKRNPSKNAIPSHLVVPFRKARILSGTAVLRAVDKGFLGSYLLKKML